MNKLFEIDNKEWEYLKKKFLLFPLVSKLNFVDTKNLACQYANPEEILLAKEEEGENEAETFLLLLPTTNNLDKFYKRLANIKKRQILNKKELDKMKQQINQSINQSIKK